MNRYIKLDVISHLNNQKLYQIMSLSGNNYIPENMYEKIQMISPYLQNISDIRFPIFVALYMEDRIRKKGSHSGYYIQNLRQLFMFLFFFISIENQYSSNICYYLNQYYSDCLIHMIHIKNLKERIDILNKFNIDNCIEEVYLHIRSY